MEKLTPFERNAIVKPIEIAYRIKTSRSNCRLRQINACYIRSIMRENKIGMQCEKCLKEDGMRNGRYCCKQHSVYYRGITDCFYGPAYPFGIEDAPKDADGCRILKAKCPGCGIENRVFSMSIDHIMPITKGGLEFDRENLQWMCPPCNIKKFNHTKGFAHKRRSEHKFGRLHINRVTSMIKLNDLKNADLIWIVGNTQAVGVAFFAIGIIIATQPSEPIILQPITNSTLGTLVALLGLYFFAKKRIYG